MKKFIAALVFFSFARCYGQQSFSSDFINDISRIYKNPSQSVSRKSIDSLQDLKKRFQRTIIKDTARIRELKRLISHCRKDKHLCQAAYRRDSIKMDLPVFGITGIGNVNQESLQALNAAGKISIFARPVQFRNNAITIFASYNKSASNNDSVIYEKLIFPDIGNSAFTGTLQYDKIWRRDPTTGHAVSPFFEFGYKKIISDSSVDNQKLYFRSLAYTFGIKYVFGLSKKSNDGKQKYNLSFFGIPYLTLMNVPNEDTLDYKALVIRNVKQAASMESLTDKIKTAGLKIGFQVNSFQFFADFRSVINKPEEVPVRALQGFHTNLGFVFNADVLEFRR